MNFYPDMNRIDLMELAIYCANKYKKDNSLKQNERYVRTLYVSISEHNDVLCSYSPHILTSAHQCILVHEKKKLAFTNWYSWYSVVFINELGCIFESNLGNEFNITVNPRGKFNNQIMYLSYGDDKLPLYYCKKPFEKSIHKLWKLYLRLKDVESLTEIKLIANLFCKDEKIFELESQIHDFSFLNHFLIQERDLYKNMLDEIRKLYEKDKHI